LPPELAQALNPSLWRIAGDDGRVDGPDRYAGDPVRMDAGFAQRLINTGLIGTERTAALQHQGDHFKGKMSLGG
jgi:hypothetical protein